MRRMILTPDLSAERSEAPLKTVAPDLARVRCGNAALLALTIGMLALTAAVLAYWSIPS